MQCCFKRGKQKRKGASMVQLEQSYVYVLMKHLIPSSTG